MSLKDKFDEKTKTITVENVGGIVNDVTEEILKLMGHRRVDVKGFVNLKDVDYIIKSGENPIRFGEVGTNFEISGCKLQNLTNMPLTVGKQFNCSYNELMTLKGSPSKVKSLDCGSNRLVSLDYLPKIEMDLFCNDNKLISLKGCPKELVELDAADNNLTSVEGAPESCRTINLFSNKIKSIEGINKHIKECRYLTLSSNPINSGGLGLLLIKGLEKLVAVDCGEFTKAAEIINKYLEDGRAGILTCQEELLDAGLDEYATL